MSYSTNTILKDANGNPIPQYFDPVADVFKPIQGEEAQNVSQKGSIVSQDPNGDDYMRTADIAPHAYDEVEDENINRISKQTTKVLKSFENNTDLLSNDYFYFGNNATDSFNTFQFLDVSNYPERTITIYNMHDQPLTLRTIIFNPSETYKGSGYELNGVDLGYSSTLKLTIPAKNATFDIPGVLSISSQNYPRIATRMMGMGMDIRQTTTAPITGYLDIYITGSTA